jgi:hypothetical protein
VIDLQTIVWLVLYLLGTGIVLGLLLFLVNYIEGQFPGPTMALFTKVARIFLVVMVVLILIGVVIGFFTHTPVFRWGQHPLQ